MKKMSDNKLFRSTDNGNIEDVINKDRTAEKVAKRKVDKERKIPMPKT